MSPVPLQHATDAQRFGGKASGLATALSHGFPVPPGYALDVTLVDTLVRGEDHASVHAAIARLGGPVAVRSSAIGEDSSEASFAGQHETVLNAQDVAKAIHAVWSSGRTQAVLAYRARLGIEGPPRVAVVIQQLLVPDCAGVLFTRNPVNGSNERIIEANWGLGESVVAGLVTPERVRMAPNGSVREHDPGDKDLEIVARPQGGTEERDITGPRRHARCLDASRLAALHHLAERAVHAYPDASDLEWAFVGTDLFLLQRRAVTR